MAAYYENQLSRPGREAYGAMLRGFTAVESAVRVPLLSMQELSDVYTRLRLDHPELFYLTGFRVRSVPGASYGEILPEYLFEKGKILTHRQAIAARVQRLAREGKSLDESGKLRYLHDFICENVRYDKLKKPYSHEVIGPLTQGVGVCEGIAKSVKLLADALELPCLVALSAPEEGKRYGHAWNLIRRGGKWYHMDATFDLSLSRCGEVRYDYCGLGDGHIYRDHVRPVYPVPDCPDEGSFYYKEARLSLTKTEDAAKRTAQAVKKKKPRLVFHWRGGYLTRETLLAVSEAVRQAAEEAGKCVHISVNWPQAVFCVQFTAEPGAEAPELERAEED
ncbi:MAG: transglutaminase domain-containing protein [Oscillospiraceae bacterium]